MTRDEAAGILEDVLDALTEVGNGVTDEYLHEVCSALFRFRDEWFKVNYPGVGALGKALADPLPPKEWMESDPADPRDKSEGGKR